MTGRYSKVELAQHITQVDQRTYGRDYVANVSSVDGRSAFLDEPSNHDPVNYFQSYAIFREKGLPTKLSAEREMAVRQDPQLLELKNQIEEFRCSNPASSELKIVRRNLESLRLKLTSESLKTYRNEWIKNRRDWKIETNGKELPDDEEKIQLTQILSRLMPQRGRLAHILVSDQVVSDDQRRLAVEDLLFLITERDNISLPGEKPIWVSSVCSTTPREIPSYTIVSM